MFMKITVLINITFHLARNNIQHAGVQYIIDSVVRALDANPDRRFIYVEIGFFWRWWNEQNDAIRNKVKGFVTSGKLFEYNFLFMNLLFNFQRSTRIYFWRLVYE
jgi:hypothetical protein